MSRTSHGPDRRLGGFHGVSAESDKHWRLILEREFGHEAGLPATLLAMPRVIFETEAEYPAARWLHGLLTADAVFLEPDWSAMRLASPPGLPKTITANGRNTPWLALDLKRDGASEDASATKLAGDAKPYAISLCQKSAVALAWLSLIQCSTALIN